MLKDDGDSQKEADENQMISDNIILIMELKSLHSYQSPIVSFCRPAPLPALLNFSPFFLNIFECFIICTFTLFILWNICRLDHRVEKNDLNHKSGLYNKSSFEAP